jgi:hypothetical protein
LASCAYMPTNGPPPQESVRDELLAIAVKILDSGSALGERLGIRASALVAAAMVLLGLTVNLGKEAVWNTSSKLDLGEFGDQLFTGCFVASTLLLLASAFFVARAARPGKLKRVEAELLSEWTLSQVRGHMYVVTIDRLEAQQRTNDKKRRHLDWAGLLFVLAGLCLAVVACTLAVTHWR